MIDKYEKDEDEGDNVKKMDNMIFLRSLLVTGKVSVILIREFAVYTSNLK